MDHEKLFTYLSDYLGFGDNILKFMKSYFSDRTQCVPINRILSETAKFIISGIPHIPALLHLHVTERLHYFINIIIAYFFIYWYAFSTKCT